MLSPERLALPDYEYLGRSRRPGSSRGGPEARANLRARPWGDPEWGSKGLGRVFQGLRGSGSLIRALCKACRLLAGDQAKC